MPNLHRTLEVLITESLAELSFRIRSRLNSRQRLDQFDRKHPCVFVLSTGRVGTKLLAHVFDQLPHVKSYHEPNPKLFGLSHAVYQTSNLDIDQYVLKQAFMTARRDCFSRALSLGYGYVETSPHATFLAPVIAEVIPTCLFIHLIRDPRAVVRSGMRRRWYDGATRDNTRITPRNGTDAAKSWENFTSFQKNIWLWSETNRWISQFGSQLSTERFLVIKSEDIFSSNMKVLEQIFDFVNSPTFPERKVKRVLSKRLNAQQTGDFPQAEDWTPNMLADLEQLAGTTARQFGYKW